MVCRFTPAQSSYTHLAATAATEVSGPKAVPDVIVSLGSNDCNMPGPGWSLSPAMTLNHDKGFLGSCRMGFWHWRDVSPVTAPHTWQRCHGKPLQPLLEACSAAAGRLARVVEQRGALPLDGLDDLAFLGGSGSNSTPAHFRVPGVCQQPGSHGGSGGTVWA